MLATNHAPPTHATTRLAAGTRQDCLVRQVCRLSGPRTTRCNRGSPHAIAGALTMAITTTTRRARLRAHSAVTIAANVTTPRRPGPFLSHPAPKTRKDEIPSPIPSPRENALSGVFLSSTIFGANTRSRTADLLITNQLLYQLSYVGIPTKASPPTSAAAANATRPLPTKATHSAKKRHRKLTTAPTPTQPTDPAQDHTNTATETTAHPPPAHPPRSPTKTPPASLPPRPLVPSHHPHPHPTPHPPPHQPSPHTALQPKAQKVHPHPHPHPPQPTEPAANTAKPPQTAPATPPRPRPPHPPRPATQSPARQPPGSTAPHSPSPTSAPPRRRLTPDPNPAKKQSSHQPPPLDRSPRSQAAQKKKATAAPTTTRQVPSRPKKSAF